MKRWQKKHPPYEGEKPYLYFAFAEADSGKVTRIMRILLTRGCRVWYAVGTAGSAEELLHRQERAADAAMTLLYLSDAACTDQDTKSSVLVNQKFHRPILCLDPDGKDRRLLMGLREDLPYLPLRELKKEEDLEAAIIHQEGFTQDLMGDPVKFKSGSIFAVLSALLSGLALLTLLVTFLGARYLHWFAPEPQEIVDEVSLSDEVIRNAVRSAAEGGAITEEVTNGIHTLHLEGLPQSWADLSFLPNLEKIEIPQDALLSGGKLPDGDYVIALTGGGL